MSPKQSTQEREVGRARALAMGRRFWDFATRQGHDVQAATERDLEDLGLRVVRSLARQGGGSHGRRDLLGQGEVSQEESRTPAVHNAGYEWVPKEHGGAAGAYVGGEVRLFGPLIVGATLGPSDDDDFDTYLNIGLGVPGVRAAFTDDSKASVEGLSGSIAVGGPVRGATVHGSVGGDGQVHGAGLEPAGLRAGGGPHLGKPSLTYGVNVDEALQEFDRMVREFGSFVASEIGRRNDPEWYIGRRGMNR